MIALPKAPAARVVFTAVTVFAFLAACLPADAARGKYKRVFRYTPPSAAMAIDLYTGRILYSKNANEARFPASVTKVMTLYLLFDALRDGKLTAKSMLTVSEHAANQSPTRLGLEEGDKISVADAIGAIVTKSANDAAVVVAEALAPSEDEFARRMTQKARTLGMLNTTFRNASGLPNPDQRTTAQDLIVLGKSILADHPERSKVFSMRTFVYNGSIYRNHNTMLFNYPGMEGMKTGFTTASGFNLLASANRGDKRVLAVVLGGPSAGARNATMRTILDGCWTKALTQLAAKRAGVLVAQAKTAPAKMAIAAAKASAKPEAVPVKAEPVPVKGYPSAIQTASLSPAPVNKADRTSSALLLTAMEAGLVQKRPGTQVRTTASDTTTDEPEERFTKATEIQRKPLPKLEQTADASKGGVSVHGKTKPGRPAQTAPAEPAAPALISAVIDETPRIAEAAVRPTPPPVVLASSRVEQAPQTPQPQTIAAATVAASQVLNQPGPFHVQAGAFPERQKAEERLAVMKTALAGMGLKDQPLFVMDVALPNGTAMYRARAGGFASDVRARAACAALKKAGLECFEARAQ
jgi:D-alanyl-D-alanine carboxypeptidase